MSCDAGRGCHDTETRRLLRNPPSPIELDLQPLVDFLVKYVEDAQWASASTKGNMKPTTTNRSGSPKEDKYMKKIQFGAVANSLAWEFPTKRAFRHFIDRQRRKGLVVTFGDPVVNDVH